MFPNAPLLSERGDTAMMKMAQEVARRLLLEPLPSGGIEQVTPRHQAHGDHPSTAALGRRRWVGRAIDHCSRE
eukprot:3931122-Alexandrium_andersonii.AAC.1